MKRWGKSPPREAQATRHGKPHRVQGQIGNRGTARSVFAKADRFRVSAAKTNDSLPRSNSGQTEIGLQLFQNHFFSILITVVRSENFVRTFMKRSLMFALGTMLLLQGCGKQSPPPTQVPRTDIGPISQRLPELGQLRSVLWSAEQNWKDSFLSPPVLDRTFRVRGFAYLQRERADELIGQFEWLSVSNGWSPSLSVTNKRFESGEWWQSDGFTKKVKPQQIPGALFLNKREAVVFFDLEVK